MCKRSTRNPAIAFAMALTAVVTTTYGDLYDSALVHYKFENLDNNQVVDSGTAGITMTPTGAAGALGPAAIVPGARPWTGNGIYLPDFDGNPNSDPGVILTPATAGGDTALNTTRDTPFSVATWLQRSGTGNGMFIASKQESSGNFKGWIFQITRAGILQAIFRNQNTAAERISATANVSISDTEWHHVGMTFDYNETDPTRGLRFYIDGVQVDATSTGTNIGMAGADRDLSTAAPFTISGRNGGQTDDGGSLDELAIWKSLVTPADFLSLVTAPVTVKQWTATGSGLWSAPANWSPNGAPTSTDYIQLGGSIQADAILTIDSGGTVTGAEVNTSHKYTVVLSGPTAFKAGELNIAAGTLALASGGSNTLRASSLTVAASGATLDLADNAMILDYSATSPIADVRQHLAAGRIIDSTGGATKRVAYVEAASFFGAGGGTFGGETVSGNAILLMTRFGGDATFNGAVDFQDLVVLAQNYNMPANATWSLGDFDYDGIVGFSDLISLAQNYGQGSLTSAGLSGDFLADWSLAQSLVPEPGTTSLAAGCLAAVSGRKCRRKV
jgi:hypothetical protein